MNTRKQLRAIFLATIMVVSMIGGGATAIAGADTVGPDGPNTDLSSPDITPPDDIGAISANDAPPNPTSSTSLDPSSVQDTQIAEPVRDADGKTELLLGVERNFEFNGDGVVTVDKESVKADSEQTLGTVATEVADLEAATVRSQYYVGNILSISVDLDRIDVETIANIPGVQYVAPNSRMVLPTPPEQQSSASTEQTDNFTYGLEQIGVPAFEDQFGVSGENATISIIDDGLGATSFDELHPDIDPEIVATAENGEVTTGEFGTDPGLHGLHTSGTATGAADPAGDVPRYGVAPNASLISINTFEGQAAAEDTVAAVEFSVEQDADVASMSLGFPAQSENSVLELLMEQQIREANALGTVVIGSAGNEGSGAAGGPATSPGAEFSGLSIGASDSESEIAGFSSGALIDPFSVDYVDVGGGTEYPDYYPYEYIKPDVSAPGVDVLSSGALGTVTQNDPTYSLSSGTSMAAPHVAGAVALIQSATDDDLNANLIKAALVETAEKPVDDLTELAQRDIRYGTGIINVTAATQALVDGTLTVEGQVTDTEGNALTGATVETDDGALTTTDENGTYTLQTTSESVNVTANAFGSTPATQEVSSNSSSVDFQLEDELDLRLVNGQPSFAEFGSSFNISVDVRNLENLTIDLTDESDVSAGDVTVTVAGDEITLGEPVSLGGFDGLAPVSVQLNDGADLSEGDLIGLSHTFEGAGDSITVETGPTELTETRSPAEFSLSNFLSTTDSQPANQSVEYAVQVDVTNTGQQAGQVELAWFNGQFSLAGNNPVVELEPGETTTESLNFGETILYEEPQVVSHGFDAINVGTGVTDDTVQRPFVAFDPEDSQFEVTNLTAPESADPGELIDVQATVDNLGTADNQTVEFIFDGEVVATQQLELAGGELGGTVTFEDVPVPEEAGTFTHAVATDDDSASALITVGNVDAPSVTLVHDSPDFAPEMADLLDRGLTRAEQPANIDVVTAENVTDQVIGDTDVFLFYSLDDESAQTVIPAVENSPLTKAVYVEQFADANAIAQRSDVLGDPEESLAEFDFGGGVDVEFTIEQDHPLFEGVGNEGDTVFIHSAGDADRAFFTGADGETLATVGAGGETDGPVATVDPDSGSVLLGTIAPNTFEETSDLFSDDAAHILGNAISVGVNDIPEEVVSDVSIDADFVGTAADDEEVTVEASGVVSGGELVDDEQITFTIGDKPVTTATVTNGSATATFDPAILAAEAGQTLDVSVEEFPVDNGATVDTVDEVRSLEDGFNLLSVPQAAELSAEDVGSINVWDSQDGTYESVTDAVFDDPADLHNALYVSAQDDDARLGFTFAGDVPAAGTATLDEGWNFVGSNFKIDSIEEGDQRPLSTDLLEVDESALSVFSSDFSQQLEGSDQIGAFDAYWVFVSDDPRERAVISPAYDSDTREQDVLEAGDGEFNVTSVTSEAVDADELQTDDILGTGETAVQVTATVENIGDRIDTQFVDLEIDSNQDGTYERVDRTGLELSAESSAEVTLVYLTDATDPDGVDLRVVTTDAQSEDNQQLGDGVLSVSDQALTLDDEFIVDEIDFGGDGTLQVVDDSTGDVVGSTSVSDVSTTKLAVPIDTPVTGNVTVELVAGGEVQADRNATISEPTLDVSNEAPPFAFENETIDVPVTVTNNALVEESGVEVTLSAGGVTFSETVNLTSGETQTVTFQLDTTAFGLALGDTVEHTAAAGDGSETKVLEIAEAGVSFGDQALGQTEAGEPAVVVEDVTADAGQFVVVTDTSSDLTEIGSVELDERVLDEDIVVPLTDADVVPGEHIAHVTEDPDLLEQPGSGDEPFVNDNATVFASELTFENEVFDDATDSVTVETASLFDAGEAGGLVGDTEFQVQFHETTADGSIGQIIGSSDVLTGQNQNVQIDLDQNITASDEFVAMLHSAGENASDVSGPIQQAVAGGLAPVTDRGDVTISFQVDDVVGPDVGFAGEEITVDAVLSNPSTETETQIVAVDFGEIETTFPELPFAVEVTLPAGASEATIEIPATVPEDANNQEDVSVITVNDFDSKTIQIGEPEGSVDFQDQVISTNENGTEGLVVDSVNGEVGQFVVITDDDGELTTLGQTQLEERPNGDSVFVPLDNPDAIDQDAGETLIAHLATDPSAIGTQDVGAESTDNVLVNDDATVAYNLSFGDQILDDGTVAVDDVIGAEGDTVNITANGSVVGSTTLDENLRGGDDAVVVTIDNASEFPGEHTAELGTATPDTAGIFDAEVAVPEQAFEGDSTDQIGLTTADLLDGAGNETGFTVTVNGVSNDLTGINSDVVVDSGLISEAQDVTATLALTGDVSEAGLTSISDTNRVYDAALTFDDAELIDGADALDELTVQTADLLDGAANDTEFTVEIHETDEEGNIGSIIGNATGLTGQNGPVTAELEPAVEDGEELVAMLHFGEDGQRLSAIPSADAFPGPVLERATVDVAAETLTFNDQALDGDSNVTVEDVVATSDRTVVVTDTDLNVLGQTELSERQFDDSVTVDLGGDAEAGDYIAHLVADVNDVGDEGGIVTDDATLFEFNSEVALENANDSVAEDEAPAVVSEVTVSTADLTDGLADDTNFTVTIENEAGSPIGESDALTGQNSDVTVDIENITLDEPGTLTENLTATLGTVEDEDVPETDELPATDDATVTLTVGEEDASVSLPDQALGTSDGSAAVQVEDVTGDAGQFVVITTDDSELTQVGAVELDERTVNGEVTVEVDAGISGDFRAHLTSDVGLLDDDALVTDSGTIFGDAAVSISDQAFEAGTEEITVDSSDLQADGPADYRIVVHNQTGVEAGGVGPAIGSSADISGSQTDVSVTLNSELDTTTDVLVMLHFPSSGDGTPIPVLNDDAFGISDGQAGTITDTATIEIQQAENGSVDFQNQALGTNADGALAVLAENVQPVDIGLVTEQDAFDPQDDFLVLTNGTSVNGADEVLDFVQLSEIPDGGDAVLNASGATPGEHTVVFHEPNENGTAPDPDAPRTDADGNVVNATATVFDGTVAINDQSFVGSTDTITINSSNLQPASASNYSIVVHDQTDVSAGGVGPAIGFSGNISGSASDIQITLTQNITSTQDVLVMLHTPGDPAGTPIPTVSENGEVSFGIDDGQAGTITDTAEIEIQQADTVSIVEQPNATQTASVALDGADGGVPTVNVTDSSTGTVEGVTVTVDADGPGSLADSSTTAVDTNASGVATFDDLVIEEAGDYTLNFSINASDAEVGTSDTATSTQFSVEVDDPATVTAENVTVTANDTADSQSFTATVTDEFGNEIQGETVNVTDADGLTGLAAGDTVTTNPNGEATFTFNETSADDFDVSLELDSNSSINETVTVTVEAADANSLSIDEFQTDPITAGDAVNINISATDEFGNSAAGQTLENLTVEASEDGEVLSQSESELDANGESVQTVNGGELTTAGDQDITVDADGVSNDTDTLTVEPADADQLNVRNVRPDRITAGNDTNLTVEVLDEFGNLVDDTSTDLDNLTITSEFEQDGDVFGPADENVTGSGTFTASNLTVADNTHTLTVSADGVSSATVDVQVDAAGADTLAVENVTVRSDDDDQAVVATLEDRFGNGLAGFNVEVTDNPNGLNQLETFNSTDSNGEVRFGFNEERPDEYSLTLQGGGITEDITVTVVGDAENVQVTNQPPSEVEANETFDVEAEPVDENGNPVPDVDVSISVNSGSGTLSGTTTVSTSGDGNAAFDDLSLETADDYNLTVSIDSADENVATSANATTNDFTVEAANATNIAMQNQPGETTAGDTVNNTSGSGAPSVVVEDAFGNPVQGVDVSVEAISGSGSIAAGDTTVTSDGNGQALFDNITIEEADDYELEYSINGTDGNVDQDATLISDTFSVVAASADTILAADTTVAVSDDSQSVSVTVEDEFGNPVGGTDIEVNNIDSLSGLTTIDTTDINGQAAFGFDEERADDYDLEFNITGGPTNTSTVNLITDDPESVTIDATPSDETAETGDQNVTYTITVQGSGGTLVENVDVDATVVNGSNITFDGSQTKRTDSNGEVSFTVTSDTAQSDTELEFATSVFGTQVTDASATTTDLEFTVAHVLDQAQDEDDVFFAAESFDLGSGELEIDNSNLTVTGAGIDSTTLVGDVNVTGDNNTLQDFTIEGNLTLTGDNNDVSGINVTGTTDNQQPVSADGGVSTEQASASSGVVTVLGSASLSDVSSEAIVVETSDVALDNADTDEVVVELEAVNETQNTAEQAELFQEIAENEGITADEVDEPDNADVEAGDDGVVIPVNDTGDNAAFSSIQDAVNDAPAGATVEVASGTYNESVTIDVEGLTLEAAAGASPTIEDTQDDVNTLAVEADDVTVDGIDISGDVTGGTPTTAVEGDGATLTDLTVTHDGDSSPNVGQAIRVAASDVTIDNVGTDVTGNQNVGVGVITDTRANTGVSISNVEIVNSEFTINDDTTGVLVGLQDSGEFVGDDPVTIEDNEFDASGADRSTVSFVVDVDNSGSDPAPGNALDLNTVREDNVFTPDAVVVSDLTVPTGGSIGAIVPDAGEDEVLNADTGERFSGTTAIQDAVDAAGSGDTLRVGAGTFEESVTVDKNGLTLEGAGAAQTEIVADSTIQVTADGSGATISGFTLSAADSLDRRTVNVQKATTDVTFEQNTFVGDADAAATVIVQQEHENVAFESNEFTADGETAVKHLFLGGEASFSADTASATSSGNADTVVNNEFDSFSDTAVESEGQHANISQNIFTGASGTDETAIAVPGPKANNPNIDAGNYEITGNSFDSDITIDVLVGPEVTEDLTSENGEVGTAPVGTVVNLDTGATFDSDAAIQDAVGAAESGETLSVGPGTFNEDVGIPTDGLTLEGAGADSTTISGAVEIGQGTNSVSTTGVTVRGFTLAPDSGFAIETTIEQDSDVTVEDNRIEGAAGAAAAAFFQNPDGIEIRNNEFVGPSPDEPTFDNTVGDLLVVGSGADDDGDNYVIAENTFEGIVNRDQQPSGGNAIEVRTDGAVTIENNDFTAVSSENGELIFEAEKSTNVTKTGNTGL